ncbi:hypothetical protein [Jatrophihabitans lederbergiae]|uniref:Uncharacterized protein n=1 Tax=Jatrophihabitans lederbergiae TaxID=3075547 RepID=A0ABU2JG77_9ACTN|nr:hypothetical protein [Jatrophihabitans sp. DSM 44399]MDT0263995.1 hypothetical protein [Jatrophihabitans sp. DSM 44399]
MDPTRRIRLAPNVIPRFYQGGRKLGEFRHTQLGEYDGEDWVGSTIRASEGKGNLGLSSLPDGQLLVEAISQAPQTYLGLDHVGRYGSNLEVLVKILDAGQRLAVHVHLTRAVPASI